MRAVTAGSRERPIASFDQCSDPDVQSNLRTVPRSRGARLRRGARLSSRTVADEPRALRAIASCKVTPAGPTLPTVPNRLLMPRPLNGRDTARRAPFGPRAGGPPDAGCAGRGGPDGYVRVA